MVKFLTERARHATEESFIAEGNKQANELREHGEPSMGNPGFQLQRLRKKPEIQRHGTAPQYRLEAVRIEPGSTVAVCDNR